MATAIALGLAIGLALGALGGWGSVLAVPVLVHLAGQSPSAATATSLVAVGIGAAVGTVGHARAGRVRWAAAAAFVATGVTGAWAGTALNHRLDGDVLLVGFSLLVLVAAHRMLTACPSCTREGEDDALTAETAEPLRTGGRRTSARIVVAGSAVGFLTGLFGVGGGFVIVPALTLGLGLPLPTAIGTSLTAVAGNAVVALGFRGLGAVDWHIAGPFALTVLAGTAAGSLLAGRIPARRALHGFAVLLVAVALANGIAAALALAR
jgi:uncharacterized protein